MLTTITNIRKLVPQRGCWVDFLRAFSTVSSSAGFPRVHHFVLGAVILEHAPDIFHQAYQNDVAQEDDDADQSVDQVKDHPVVNGGDIAAQPAREPERDQNKQQDGHRNAENHREGHRERRSSPFWPFSASPFPPGPSWRR